MIFWKCLGIVLTTLNPISAMQVETRFCTVVVFLITHGSEKVVQGHTANQGPKWMKK